MNTFIFLEFMHVKWQLCLWSFLAICPVVLEAYNYRHEPWQFERKSQPSMPDYNFRAGPVYFDLVGSLSFEYDSNVNFSRQHSREDFIVHPKLQLDGLWEFSSVNSLGMSLGLGYQKYLKNSNLDGWRTTLETDSELNLTVQVDTLTLQFYERPAYLTDAADASRIGPGGELVREVDRYARFENQMGIRGFYDLNILMLDFHLMRADEIPSGSDFFFREKHEHLFQVRASKEFSSFLSGGVGVSFSEIRYREPFLNSGDSRSIGPYILWTPSEYLSFSGGISWVQSNFGRQGEVQDLSQPGSANFNLEARHLLNRFYSHRLALSRRTNYGFLSNTTDISRVAYTFNYDFTERLTFTGSVSYERGRDSRSVFAETFNRMSYSLRTGWVLGPGLSLSVFGTYSDKSSSDLDRSYSKTRMGLSLRYDF